MATDEYKLVAKLAPVLSGEELAEFMKLFETTPIVVFGALEAAKQSDEKLISFVRSSIPKVSVPVSSLRKFEALIEAHLSTAEESLLMTEFGPALLLAGTGELNKDAAKSILQKLRDRVHTKTRFNCFNVSGYVLDGIIMFHQENISIVKVAHGTRSLCAKIGPTKSLEPDHQSSEILRTTLASHQTINVIEAFLPLDDQRSALVSEYYGLSLTDLVAACGSQGVAECALLNIAICGICTIYGFFLCGLAHCDLKPANMVLSSSGVVVTIDLGSVRPIGESMKSTTAHFTLMISEFATTVYDVGMLVGTLYSLCYPKSWTNLVLDVQNDPDTVRALLLKQKPSPKVAIMLALLDEVNGVDFERLFHAVRSIEADFVKYRENKTAAEQAKLLHLDDLLPVKK